MARGQAIWDFLRWRMTLSNERRLSRDGRPLPFSSFRRGLGANPSLVAPAKAGVHRSDAESPEKWVPAFAGMTVRGFRHPVTYQK
jgi:hypothetical protein